MKEILRTTLLILSAIFCFYSCNKFDLSDLIKDQPEQKPANAQVSVDWYKLQLRILLERNSSMNGVYFGYIGIGLYEAVRNENKDALSFSSILYQMPQMPSRDKNKEYNWEVSANASMASMTKYYFAGLTAANTATIDSLENAYNKRLLVHVSTSTFNRSQEFGRSIAKAVYNWSLTDNFNGSNTGYIPPVFPGAWIPTPPAFANGILPFVSTARPFLSANLSAKASPFPFPYSEFTSSDFYKMAKKVYTVSKSLTTEQKNIALFFVDQGNGIGYTPPGHDFFIITQAVEATEVNLIKAAEAFAKAGIAERDATIVCFRSKYLYNLIRPISYIQKIIEPGWQPFIVTPPHPEYPAAHAFITGSVMQAVTNVLGNHVKVTDHSYDFRGWTPRVYNSLFAAAEEAGISRLYGGIHYLPSIEIGLSLGEDLGNKIGKLKLRN